MSGIRNSNQNDRFIVYKHTNKINNKSYIGITKRTLEERVRDGYSHNEDFCNDINRYGWCSFESVILEEGLTLEEANIKEVYYISKYKSNIDGYNIQSGGIHSKHNKKSIEKMSKSRMGNTNALGYIHSEKTKNQISESLKSFYNDEERSAWVRERQSNANTGKVVSEETRRKRSEKLKGRIFSPETIEKMRHSALKRWRKEI